MPTYDYVCRFCDHEFEHFQGIHDPLLRKCPECGRHGLKRQFGVGAGVVFKGSGFYETDYKRKDSGSSEKGADKPAAKEDKAKGSDDGKGGGAAGKQTGPSGDKPA